MGSRLFNLLHVVVVAEEFMLLCFKINYRVMGRSHVYEMMFGL